MTAPADEAESVYARIRRRRDRYKPGDADVIPGTPAPTGAAPLRNIPLGPVGWDPAEAPSAGSSGAAAGPDTFPRSATMRAILKHPALALGVGLPAVGLLLSSPASRRVLAVALRIGTRPELHHLLQLAAAAPAPARRFVPDGTPESGRKKAP